jgi:hypothetical protein
MPRFLTLIRYCALSAIVLCIACATGGGGSDDSNTNNFQATNSDSSSNNATGGSSEFSSPILSNLASAFSRGFCGTAELDQQTILELQSQFLTYLAQESFLKAYGLNRETVNIPVIFHVISKGPSAEDGEVPDTMLNEQIAVLNRAYSGETGGVDTPFRFSLLGINRVRNPDWHVFAPGSTIEVEVKPQLKTGGANVLNVYLVDIETPDGSEGQILGYSTLPVLYRLLEPYDGIVMNFRTLPGGSLNNYNTGHVLVHESGHWLGLFHTFLGECDGLFTDLISDTPREQIPSGDPCPEGRDSCPDHPGLDPIHNHMSYTVDSCRTEFTESQISFMQFNASIFRQVVAF